ncbi:metal ABC transporter solute-binding protein, Zn/Mn family [Methanoregula sp.]|uniref:metal ABC transporter solute-binding protein, Zn/Mn family n=1 Tax=Methanoregula sp. TaxID=2052170 RepID=UPI002BE08F89|nr:zinc ABC transporter substrate-binding protein [Methanoregula sp.]HVP96884.1 zinc ABC transporter substrate-binding protein [Methanoregula sp.]
MKSKTYVAIGGIAFFIIMTIFIIVAGCTQSNSVVTPPNSIPNNTTQKIQIVVAENFWGSLVSQIGGSHVQVLSIVSDPNADPHEYESNTANARAFATADYIIVNGAGYDEWADKLISAGIKPNAKVLNVANLIGQQDGDNPHFWYSPDYVNQTTKQMESDLISIDPSNTKDYEQNYANLQVSLSQYQNRIGEIKQQFGGTKVAATESIFEYLANATGLDLVSPPAFTHAVAEGNDPPADSVVQFETQLQSDNVSVLVYNQQTVTPLTDNIKKLASEQGIPVIGITETIQPPDVSFQDWMNAELISLQNALNAKSLGS